VSFFKKIFNRQMLVSLIMGFACGLPLLLTMSVLQARMKEDGIDLTIIGLVNLVQIPYTWKFVWAPFLDRFIPPFLGRRKGWLAMAQFGLILAIAGLGYSDPVNHFGWMVFTAICVAFFSATQDIVVDAYRREDLSDEELGLGSSFYIYGYRMGTLLASGGGLIMADFIPWSHVYLLMCICMLPAVATTLLTPEPHVAEGSPKTLKDAVIQPIVDYFTRKDALWILSFILFYKIGDTMAGAMTMPFYLEIGFSKTQIGAVVKIFGTWAIIGGAITGGIIMFRFGIHKSLWMFGVLQALSTACFVILARMGDNMAVLSVVITFENVSSGMGTAAFVAFMASITNKKFTATQYALLSSLMAFPRVLASAPTGFLAKHLGWESFFIFCTLIAIPGMLMLFKFSSWQKKPSKAPIPGEMEKS
jgi:MFS transporter, PAT family, beta-lactamase induction signal transducer AmpG